MDARIAEVRRLPDAVELVMQDGNRRCFDQVVFACHSDQARHLLADATLAEQQALEAIPYQENEVVLHTDTALLPRARRAWSSWNYWLRAQDQMQAVLTYNMNILQGISSPHCFCVTLNASDAIDSRRIIDTFTYSHPVFSLESVSAAHQLEQFNGRNRTWFAGAYLGNGVHEDGVVSGRKVADGINRCHGDSAWSRDVTHA